MRYFLSYLLFFALGLLIVMHPFCIISEGKEKEEEK